MSALALRLEDFDALARGADPARDGALAEARGEGRAEGYAEGFAAGLAHAEAEDRETVAALAELMRDFELGRLAARSDAEARLRPLIDALARIVFPQAAAESFADVVAEVVHGKLAASPQARLTAHVAPDRVEGVARRLGSAARVVGDGSLTGCRARIGWSDGGVDIDVDGCLEAARAALVRVFGEPEERTRNVG